jgi:predicted glutamine amidotransferase
MCRLIGSISTAKMNATKLLCTAPQSLLRQSHVDRRRKQGDGWGAGYFEHGQPKLIKSPRPMYREKKRVEGAARKVKGRVLIAHVRWASNPLKLKRRDLIGLAHTQPFIHGRWLFAHNGTLYIPREVTAALGSWKKYIKGKNDSEVLFYWLLKHLARTKNPARAVRSAIRGLHRIWDGCKKSYPIHPYPYHGLNWVLSDGHTLMAFCYTDPHGFGKSKALCDRRQCYYQLRRRVTPEGVLVASEPLDQEAGWKSFRHGELLIARRQRRRIVSRSVKVL